MVVVRGINVFPTQVATILNRHPTLSGEYRIVLDGPGPHDLLAVEAELSQHEPDTPAALADTIAAAFKHELGITARINLLTFGALPRTEGKSRRVVRRDRS